MRNNGDVPITEAYSSVHIGSEVIRGLTKREVFAGVAMHALIVATVNPGVVWNRDELTETAKNLSNDLLKALEE